MDDFKDKIKNVNIGLEKRRKPKVTTDVHDTHKVHVTEHWEERQDVTVCPETVRIRVRVDEEK